MPVGIYQRTDKHKEALRLAWVERKKKGLGVGCWKGKNLSTEHKDKLRQAKLKNPVRYWLDKKRPEVLDWLSPYQKGCESPYKGKKRPEVGGEKQPTWKGENVSYRNLHRWIERQLGKPDNCSHCGKIGYGRQMHWANKSRNYQRNITDWIRLCPKCHKAYDRNQLALPSQA